MKKNPVMNYNQFMRAFKSAEKGYGKSANVSNHLKKKNFLEF